MNSEQELTPEQEAARIEDIQEKLKYWTLDGMEQDNPLRFLLGTENELPNLAQQRRLLWNLLCRFLTHPDSERDAVEYRFYHLECFWHCMRLIEMGALIDHKIDNNEILFSYPKKNKPRP